MSGKAAKSVIRVVIVPKLGLGDNDTDDEESEMTEDFEEAENETDTDDSEKFEVPEIVITETDEVIEGMKRPIDSSKLISNSGNMLLPESAGGNKFLTIWQESARPKQPKLLPDTFVEFIRNCKNLISDLRKTMEERLDAGEWILEFDGKMEKLEQEEREEKEKVRREREKEEEARARAEAWWRRRAISRPLANPAPRLTFRDEKVDVRSCHDRVCPLPLVILKKRLEKVERVLLAEGTVREGLKREDVGKSSEAAIQKMATAFKAYLQEIQVKADGILEVHGVACIRAEDRRFDDVYMQKREVKEIGDKGLIEDVLHVGKKKVYGKVVIKDLADQYCFQWKFTKGKGILGLSKRRDSSSRKKAKMVEKTEDVFAIFNPEKSKREKGFQAFGSTLHATMSKNHQYEQIPSKNRNTDIPTKEWDRKGLITTVSNNGKSEKGKILSYKFMPQLRFCKKVRVLWLFDLFIFHRGRRRTVRTGASEMTSLRKRVAKRATRTTRRKRKRFEKQS